ncbi:MAG: hypothetical protein HY901_15800 [Deltaproteobacteria bacterium]|nr:hypothetical protein [Deltaproteobacteria bacterium]
MPRARAIIACLTAPLLLGLLGCDEGAIGSDAQPASDAAGESPSDAAGESPSDAAGESPSDAAGESLSDAAGESPSDAAEESPSDASGESPLDAAGESLSDAAGEGPSDAAGVNDTTPPFLSNGAPSGALPSGTASTTMSVSTDEPATCRWSTSATATYASMSNVFATTGGTSHSTLKTGLVDGQSYTYYVRCRDAALNANTTSYVIDFNVTAGTITITQVAAVPAWTDETATYMFTSSAAGTIVYGGSCGSSGLTAAIAGENQITWTLANGTYSNCTIRVASAGVQSNVLTVPTFKATTKYPVLFVHGLFGNAATAWDTAISFLVSQGWAEELLIARSMPEAINGLPLCGASSVDQAVEVGRWFDAVVAAFPGFSRIDLVGHSRGGGNIMDGLWFGHIDVSKVRRVVTLSGANRNCADEFGSIPADETPGDTLYSVYWADGANDCDATDWIHTNITGSYYENLYPLCHGEMKSHATALAALKESLLGNVGGNDDN